MFVKDRMKASYEGKIRLLNAQLIAARYKIKGSVPEIVSPTPIIKYF